MIVEASFDRNHCISDRCGDTKHVDVLSLCCNLNFTRTLSRSSFCGLELNESFGTFSENEWAFDLLYCVAFMVMDKQWLDRNATYMEFNVSDSTYTSFF